MNKNSIIILRFQSGSCKDSGLSHKKESIRKKLTIINLIKIEEYQPTFTIDIFNFLFILYLIFLLYQFFKYFYSILKRYKHLEHGGL